MTKLLEYRQNLNPVLDKKKIRKLERDYWTWIRQQSCIISNEILLDNDYIVEIPHHVRMPGNAGTSLRPSNLYAVPLKLRFHIEWEHEGNRFMERKYDFEIWDKLTNFHEEFNEIYKIY